MLLALQVVTVFLVAVTMSLALAHVLELPGKLRLDEQTYLAVQTIYYPGFTIGGISEPLAIMATAVLLLVGPKNEAKFLANLRGMPCHRLHATGVLACDPTCQPILVEES